MVDGKAKAVGLKTKSMHTCFGDDEVSLENGRIKDRQFLSFRTQDWKILE